MNYQEMDILQAILSGHPENQRKIAELSGCSIGIVNRSLKTLKEEGYVDDGYHVTEKAEKLAKNSRPKRAVILAAGYGMRMIPVQPECPKGLLTVHGEVLIEHTIRQLRKVGVKEIVVAVGFMLERYEYLTEEFGVKLVVCRDYATRNNLYSLAAAKDYLEEAYIVPSDIYCYRNPFHPVEFYPWYLAGKDMAEGSGIYVTRGREVLLTDEDSTGNRVIGIAYLTKEEGIAVRKRLEELTREGKNRRLFWEAAASEGKQMTLTARLFGPEDAVEINTYQQLREIEYYAPILQNDTSRIIREVFHVKMEDIKDIQVLKKGVTNRSFLFTIKGEKYIMRVPGDGTEEFIDRKAEKEIYDGLAGKGLSEEVVYLDPEKGYKISKFIENSRAVDETNPKEVAACMKLARTFHELGLPGSDRLDLFEMIQYYEDKREGKPSEYKDYERTKEHCMSLRSYVKAHAHKPVRAHGDMNPDNFLVSYGNDGEMKVNLIDWEYSAVADPLTDIAAFITYHMHDRAFADQVIDAYYPEGCTEETRLLIYCYIALWGLYFSNWCEYRRRLGIETGEFAITVYRYAKEFYKIFEEEYHHEKDTERK